MSTATLIAPLQTITVESDPMPAASPAVATTAPISLAGEIRRIVLTGFMGAGKTTVGRHLAADLGWEFVDLDTLIEQRTGLTVPQIFAQQGEVAFRRIESHALAVALGRKQIVLALGGGAPETLTNRLLLEQTPGTLNVYLHAPLDVLTARCEAQQDGVERPVLADKDGLARRFATRLTHYQRLAGVTIDTTSTNASDTTALLRESIRQR